MQSWQLQEAKNRLSEVIERARKEGPQAITCRGRETAVIVSIDEFRRLTTGQGDLVSFLRSSPLFGVELDLSRDRDTGRPIEL